MGLNCEELNSVECSNIGGEIVMTDIVDRLEAFAKSYPEIDMDDVWEAITQFTRLRARVAELEVALKEENPEKYD